MQENYTGPFWEGRYGKSGRAHAEQDVNYHLDNLVTAIRMGLISSPVYYYRYLQSVLVSRGMCTRHILQTLDSMQRLLQDLLPAYWPEIKPFLDAGNAGLSYSDPACQALAGHETSIAQATTDRWSELDGIMAIGGPDALFLLSYLNDAVGKQRPEIFKNYVKWLAASSLEPERFVKSFQKKSEVLLDVLTQELGSDKSEPFRDLLKSL